MFVANAGHSLGFQSFLESRQDWGPVFSPLWVWLKAPSWTFLLWGEKWGGKGEGQVHFILH